MNSSLHLLKSIEEENEVVKIKDINPSSLNQPYKYYNEEEEDSNDEDIHSDEEEPMCGCGKTLTSGWNCIECRHNCTTCHRALTLEEICSRCHVERDTNFPVKK
ncbi:hypothetical protein MFLAVUS_007458 [Mucor flavus]|uniref:Uncharacterized protein n=1 Tax=Mucor flavus TaxID=439312 RepID=A0ABP9Z4D7_9FUNG